MPDLLSRLLFRDALILVIDKPAGLPVHRGPKGGATVEDGLDALRFGLPHPPALAHRLDRDTSGCLVLGRHRKATARLSELFAAGRVRKTYLAVLDGAPAGESGLVDVPLARRSPDPRSWWMKVDAAGQPSRTEWRVLGRDGDMTAVELRPLTGRTHQLRVHMAHLGCPILGDGVYGRERSCHAGRPMHLHAWAVTVPLSDRKPAVAVEAPPPGHMRELLDRCRAPVQPLMP